MFRHLWESAVILSGLLAAGLGCRSVPPIPEEVRARGYTATVPEEGWLYRKLTGQEVHGASSQARAASEATTASGVTTAAAEQPVTPKPLQDGVPGATGEAPAGKVLLEAVPPSGKGYVVDEIEKEEDGFELSDLAPKKVYQKLKALAGYGPNEGVARALYQEGQELFNQKQYAEAAAKFKSAADRWPDSPLEEDALFMLGESYFFADRYPRANDAYSRLLKKYEYTRHLDTTVTRLFAIGRYWEQLSATLPAWQWVNLTDSGRPWFDTFGYGIKAYESVRLHDPTGPLADDAVMATANAYFVRGRFEEAAYQYDLIRKDYPKSEHQVKAHLLGMKSKMQVYQGPLYEGSPLKDASEIAQQTLTLFGKELGEERQKIVEAKNQMTEELARRDLTVGQYYDRKGYYGAARYYYQAVLEEYPHTVAARMAETRLQQIRDLPAEPPERFKWLTDMLSTKK